MRQQTESFIGPCLSEVDFYNFVTGSRGERRAEDLELHLIRCDACREELVGLLQILDGNAGEDAQAVAPPSEKEIQKTLSLIQNAAHRNLPASPRRTPSWRQWATAAAALIVLVGLSALLALNYFDKRTRSERFYNQARTALERAYVPVSPNGLRLELPFPSSGPDQRAPADEEALNRAENFFYQALALRENMTEARLGLAFLYLNKARFSNARVEFQNVLNSGSRNPRALLGRGVTLCEEGLASRDPVERKTRLDSALADFEAVLKIDPASGEAQYNKALTLYEMGKHREALVEIDRYLSRDLGSIWSQRLRNIQLKIRATRSEVVGKEVNRAALARDAGTLERLATLLPYQIPEAIRGTLKSSLEAKDSSHQGESPGPASLIWAARTLEAAYSAVTGDQSYKRLIDFYGGLSPPEREKKNLLDSRLQNLVDLHREGNHETALRNTAHLAREYQRLGDYWQLVNLYHLRGNSFFYNRADFRSAAREYGKMLRYAEHARAPDLIARALGSQASIYNQEHKYDDGLACLIRMQEISGKYRLELWEAYAHQYLGNAYLKLNQLEASLKECASALALAWRLQEEQLVVESLENLGEVLEQLGRDRDASQFFGLALQARDEYSAFRGRETQTEMVQRLNILCKLGYLALRRTDLAPAQTHFRAALKAAPQGARELRTRIRIGLAQVFIEARDFDSAERELRLTGTVAASAEFPELAWQFHYLNGVLQRQSGDNDGARAEFRQAIRILEGIRRGISSEELRQAFLHRRFDPYRETVSLLYKSQDKLGALQFVEKSKSMTLTEHLVSQQRDPGLRFPEIKRDGAELFPENLAILEYFFLSDRLLAFVSWKDRLEMFSLEVPAFRLEDQVRQYAESISSERIEPFNALSRKLYDQLLGPVLRLLPPRGVDTLLILPDGPLYKLPFAGLQDSDGRYLLEKFALTYAPSRGVFRHCLSLNRGNAATQQRSILLLDGTDGLRAASEELAKLAGVYGSRATLMGPGRMNAIKAKAAESEILHFAGHAVPSGGKPRLLFSSLPQSRYLDAATISSWSLPRNRLVFLAGCNTGIGPSFEGHAPWGLLPAFFSAGVPAVVCSLLTVEDRGARDLTLRFYAELTQGSSKARALQVAQLSIVKDLKTKAYEHPRSWLPFVLVGDPR